MSKIKILIAEDDILMLRILEFLLKKEGYKVTAVKNGMEAIEQIDLISPDLIITDIIMPLCSGLEVIIYTKKQNINIPIIVVSSLGEEEADVIEALNLGANDFLSKPFNPNEIITRVNRVFKNM